jgi:hypothetical protein
MTNTDDDRVREPGDAMPAGGRSGPGRRVGAIVAILVVGLSSIVVVRVARVQQEKARQAEAADRMRALQLQYQRPAPTTSKSD